jgi:hypothetical protein
MNKIKLVNTNTFRESVFWIFLGAFYFLLGFNHSVMFGLVISSILTSGQILVTKVNHFYLYPKYYKKDNSRKYLIYSIIFLFIVVCFYTTIEIILDNHKPPKDAEDDGGSLRFLFPFFLNSLAFGIAFAISLAIKLYEKEKENSIKIKELQKTQVETELKFLKTQINPHFLFNALNNIYTISYKEDSLASQKILDLSDMLRYVLYDCKGESVNINKEIEYIELFINFQQLKTKESQNINLNVSGIKPLTTISPMIMMPFIENSFKHSKIDKDKDAFVNIDIKQTNGDIIIEVENSLPNIPPAKMLYNSGGIGLENVKKRLDLLYKDRYVLDIIKTENKHIVKLIIRSNGSN